MQKLHVTNLHHMELFVFPSTWRKSIILQYLFMARCHCGGLSFGLPEGLYLGTFYELGRENSIKFQDNDKTYSVELSFLTYEETAESYIKAERQRCIEADRFIYGDHHPDIKPIRQIKLNDLVGFVFLDGRDAEAHFESAHGDPIHLNIYIGIRGSKCMENVLACQVVKAFLADIKTEAKE